MGRRLRRENLTDSQLENLSDEEYIIHKMSLGLSKKEAEQYADLRKDRVYFHRDASGFLFRSNKSDLTSLTQDFAEFAREVREAGIHYSKN